MEPGPEIGCTTTTFFQEIFSPVNLKLLSAEFGREPV
jgi:hypothetical protein